MAFKSKGIFMILNLISKVFGTANSRKINKLLPIVKKINSLEPSMEALSNEELTAKTDEFKKRLAKGETLDDILPEAFAVVRESSKRILGQRHYDVQLMGGIVLHEGSIAEMKTGEGKTLTATLPLYLNALEGKGAHLVTVNEYLASRDAEWMGKLYNFLGLSVATLKNSMDDKERKKAYEADILYATNSELGFDYLRDNMKFRLSDYVQRDLNYAIVDEVDSILIDEARTPLIISGAQDDSTDLYTTIDKVIPSLEKQKEAEGPGDFSIDEKSKQAHLTEDGHEKVEKLLTEQGLISEGESLYDANNIMLMHHLNAGLRAHALFDKDVDYIVSEGEIVIVDEHTGRTMPGRRWSDGLHQAVEAKERVEIKQENQTLASITFQNFFRLYDKLSGMTGTADTEAYEFQQIYNLEVSVLPTNKSMVRKDLPDYVYMTIKEKFDAIVEDVQESQKKGQPILVGTTSIETSEYLSNVLKKSNIKHNVLNAKFHEKEAEIIAEAGRPGAVTIATNMAGRGTDIVLGGNLQAELSSLDNPSEEEVSKRTADWEKRNKEVIKAGGLYILGTERHESRRVDNQLRGRSGRQGDPGKSRFYLSLEDNLLRIFGGERITSIIKMIGGIEKGVALESRALSNRIESAQRKVEAHNFDIRKQLLEYDDVANDQRQVIYKQRDELLSSDNIKDTIVAIQDMVIENVISDYIAPQSLEDEWDIKGLEQRLMQDFNINAPVSEWLEKEDDLHEENLRSRIKEQLKESYAKKESQVEPDVIRQFEKAVMLQNLDNLWREHLAAMDYLRQGIHLRGYAQKNPKQEYKRESFELFRSFLDKVNFDVVSTLSKFEVRQEESLDQFEENQRRMSQSMHMEYHHDNPSETYEDDDVVVVEEKTSNVVEFASPRTGPKVGRNEACPCGSGKKYKQCHGKIN